MGFFDRQSGKKEYIKAAIAMGLSHNTNQRDSVIAAVKEFAWMYRNSIVEPPDINFDSNGSTIGITIRVPDIKIANKMNAELRRMLVNRGIRWDD